MNSSKKTYKNQFIQRSVFHDISVRAMRIEMGQSPDGEYIWFPEASCPPPQELIDLVLPRDAMKITSDTIRPAAALAIRKSITYLIKVFLQDVSKPLLDQENLSISELYEFPQLNHEEFKSSVFLEYRSKLKGHFKPQHQQLLRNRNAKPESRHG